ncbi:hypothetical protein [Parafannyhessea umbonata]|uniref:hypothetical protein n=1 Tax=Parafannyhessea umbonata TaxID=604330 RepID=UPI00197F2A7B|nr:hypothetical protein [Parafannyhessea umbonata]
MRFPRIADSRPANLPHSYRALFSQGILSTTALRALPRPVDIIVEKDSDRLYGKQIRNHVWMRQIPERSFVTIEPSVRLSTPEFTYLQMATVISLPRLASYACEIVEGYSLNQGGRSFHARPPLTNLGLLAPYLSKCAGARGVCGARKTLSYAVEGFRSPAGTSLALLLTLPARLGGYGLPTCASNHRIDLAESWERYLRTPYLPADLAWPTEMVAMEYDNIVRQRVAPPLGVTPPLRTGLFAQRSDDLRSQLLG